jgi:phospholipid/cholesterol/gamma-HCH transport system permease protein
MSAAAIRGLGASALTFVGGLGRISFYGLGLARRLLRPPVRWRAFAEQVHHLGVLSLLVICVSGFTVGMVMAIQGYNTLHRFGATSALGSLVALSLIRELGPVLTALLVTGRAGSAATAQIASMVVTEQFSALRMMSVDPVHYVLAPRFVGMLVVMPLLTALFIVSGLAGGYLLSVFFLGVDPGVYQNSVTGSVEFLADVAGGLLKSIVFGGLVGLVCTYLGYTSRPTTAGVSAATTGTVVVSSVAILASDYVLTALWKVGQA